MMKQKALFILGLLLGSVQNAHAMDTVDKKADDLRKRIQAAIDEMSQREAQRREDAVLKLRTLVNQNAEIIPKEPEFKAIQLKIDAFYKRIERSNSAEEMKKEETLEMVMADAREADDLAYELQGAQACYEGRINKQ